MHTRKVASSTRETVRSNCRPFRIGISSRNMSDSPSMLPSGRAGRQGDLSEMARMLSCRAAHCSSRGQPRISRACRCSCASSQSRPARKTSRARLFDNVVSDAGIIIRDNFLRRFTAMPTDQGILPSTLLPRPTERCAIA